MIRAYRDVALSDDPTRLCGRWPLYMVSGTGVVDLSAFWDAAGDVAQLCYLRAIA